MRVTGGALRSASTWVFKAMEVSACRKREREGIRHPGGCSALWPGGTSVRGRAWPKSRTSTRSEEHTSELQSLMRTSYAVFCLKKKKTTIHKTTELKERN